MKMNNIDQIRLLYWWKLIEKKMFPLHISHKSKDLKDWSQQYKNYITSYFPANHKYNPNLNEIKIKNFSFGWQIEPNLNFNLTFRFERGIFKITSSTLNSLKYEKIPTEINNKLLQIKNELFPIKICLLKEFGNLLMMIFMMTKY